MNRLLTATAVVALLSGAAVAQSSPPNTGSSTTTQMTTPPAAGSTSGASTTTTTTTIAAAPSSMNFVTQQADRQWLASDIVGATVYGPDDANIGSVNDLLTGDDGKVVAAVIGVGGFLGIGQKNVAVNFDALQKSLTPRGDVKVSLSATADQLKAAPDFKTMKEMNSARTATTSPATGTTTTTPAAPAR